jgi:uncharacterized protein YjiS (DUF1127 family)
MFSPIAQPLDVVSPRSGLCSWRRTVFTGIRGFLATSRVWAGRSHDRRLLREMADRNDRHLLEDIGVGREEARHEAIKLFWQR